MEEHAVLNHKINHGYQFNISIISVSVNVKKSLKTSSFVIITAEISLEYMSL